MTSKDLAEIKARVLSWSHAVNPQRRIDALRLIEEVKRLRRELKRAYEPMDERGSNH